MKETIVIGDVHGCFDTLMELLKKIPDIDNKRLVFVGDLIDRGKDSMKVVDFVMKNNHYCVLGNHEEMMIEEDGNPYNIAVAYASSSLNNWGKNGGIQTANSYNEYDLIEKHIEWMKTLPHYLIFDDIVDNEDRNLLVSHSYSGEWIEEILDLKECINKEDFHYQSKEELESELKILKDSILWNRRYPNIKDTNFFNVFGHTPTDFWIEKYPMKNFKDVWDDGVIVDKDLGFADVDTGAVYKNKLSAIEYPSMKVYTTPFKG